MNKKTNEGGSAMKNKPQLHSPGKAATWLLRIGSPLIVLEGIAILVAYLDDRRLDPILANDRWATSLSDLLAAVLLLVGLGFLADVIDADLKKRQ